MSILGEEGAFEIQGSVQDLVMFVVKRLLSSMVCNRVEGMSNMTRNMDSYHTFADLRPQIVQLVNVTSIYGGMNSLTQDLQYKR